MGSRLINVKSALIRFRRTSKREKRSKFSLTLGVVFVNALIALLDYGLDLHASLFIPCNESTSMLHGIIEKERERERKATSVGRPARLERIIDRVRLTPVRMCGRKNDTNEKNDFDRGNERTDHRWAFHRFECCCWRCPICTSLEFAERRATLSNRREIVARDSSRLFRPTILRKLTRPSRFDIVRLFYLNFLLRRSIARGNARCCTSDFDWCPNMSTPDTNWRVESLRERSSADCLSRWILSVCAANKVRKSSSDGFRWRWELLQNEHRDEGETRRSVTENIGQAVDRSRIEEKLFSFG